MIFYIKTDNKKILMISTIQLDDSFIQIDTPFNIIENINKYRYNPTTNSIEEKYIITSNLTPDKLNSDNIYEVSLPFNLVLNSNSDCKINLEFSKFLNFNFIKIEDKECQFLNNSYSIDLSSYQGNVIKISLKENIDYYMDDIIVKII
jgi:hypothetical protein